MIRWLLSIGCLLASSLLHGQTFSALLSKKQVPVGEVFQVTFQLENAQASTPNFPSFDGFQVRGGPSTSQSVQMINGAVTQSISFSFYLQGTKTGTFTIGAATVEAGGKTLRTEPLKVKVVAANSGGSAGSRQQANANGQTQSRDIDAQLRDAVFVRALISDRDVYQGEQITVSYKLYERVQTFDLRPEGTPTYEGFWVENIDVRNPPPRMETYQGKQYRTYVIKKDILFPQRPGELTIDPLKLSVGVRVQTAPRRGRRSVFDSFFGNYENYKYSFASPTVRIKARPLPAGRPADFSGIVGKLDLDVSLDTASVETGEPLTLKVALSGRGNIKKLREPTLGLPPDFEVYDPNVSESISRSGGVMSGKRSYEYLVIPRNPGTYRLPPITYSYFDAASGRYRSLSSPEFSVKVTGDAQIASGGTATTPDERSDLALINQDIRYIQPRAGDLQEKGSTFLLSAGFWLLYLLPLLAIGGLWVVKSRQMRDRRDVAGARRRKAAKLAHKRLAQAKQHLQGGQEKAFYDEVMRALWDYLGNKFNIGQSELSREHAAELLRGIGAEEEQIQRLHRLLDTCEMALFAPSAAPGGMQGTYDEAADLITELEDVRPQPQFDNA